jgi:single-stranded-DNA-specific exonuclease
VLRRRWLLANRQAEAERRLASELDVSPLLARLLLNRGVAEPASARGFLGGRLSTHLRSPMLFRDMGKAAERIVTALRRGERVGIYGDYDVDGISGSAVLVRFLRALGSEPVLHIPHRLKDGYGLTEPGVRRLAEAGARVMVTVDCGGVSHREIELANRLGMDCIVCDHHQVSGVPLPAHAVLNPIEPDAGFPFAGLCGAGVAFYLSLGVRMMLRETGATRGPDLRRCLDLVALGTVADLVPILEENRVLVKYGLRELASSTRPGVVALRAISGAGQIDTGVVGFRLAPRLNAGGRLADARRSVELLITEDHTEAERLAAGLDEENRARRDIERRIFDEAVAMVEGDGSAAARRSLVLASPEWHPGVIGIVASRLVERYYRPTILIASNCGGGVGRGSGRSIRGLNLHDALGGCRDLMIGFGGHRMAAGLSIHPHRIPLLRERFEQAVRERTTDEHFVAVREVDAELGLRQVDDGCLRDLERLEPHGQGNPGPVFLARDVLVRASRLVGETHLKLHVEQEGRVLPAIGFGMAEHAVEPGRRLDLLYTPMVSDWGAMPTVELRVRDLRAASGT